MEKRPVLINTQAGIWKLSLDYLYKTYKLGSIVTATKSPNFMLGPFGHLAVRSPNHAILRQSRRKRSFEPTDRLPDGSPRARRFPGRLLGRSRRRPNSGGLGTGAQSYSEIDAIDAAGEIAVLYGPFVGLDRAESAIRQISPKDARSTRFPHSVPTVRARGDFTGESTQGHRRWRVRV